jgi:glycerate kinase
VKIDVSNLDKRVERTEVFVACDVNNPLLGPQGASAVYAPQKGATPEMVAALEAALTHYAAVLARDLGKDVSNMPGAGAAGGLGAGLIAFLNAIPRMGIALVLEAVRFEEYVEAADLVITGEGRVDEQTLSGKVVSGVGRMASRKGVPVIALAGEVADEAFDRLAEVGVKAVESIAPGPISLDEAIRSAGPLLQAAAERVMRLILIGADLGRFRAD